MAEVSWRAIDEAGAGGWTVRARAADFLKGVVGTVGVAVDGEEGWIRPLRFTDEQVRALSSCAAWHPALYRAQAAATAGVRLEVRTAATRIAFEVTRGVGSRWTGDAAIAGAEDGFSVDVDDEHIERVVPDVGTGLVVVDLEGGTSRTMGRGRAREESPAEPSGRVVRLWLPYLSGCAVRGLLADRDVEPVEGGPRLLVIGDSIAQGEDAHDPGLSWPARLVREAGVDLLNQGLLGQVFQPSAVSTLAGVVDPDCIWVALGANYRLEECYAGTVERDVRACLAFMRRQWRDRRIWIATPTPHDESLAPSSPRSCWRELPAILERVCERWPQFTVVDGSDLLDDDPGLRGDADHPNVRGHAEMARRIARVLQGGEALTEEEREERAMPGFLRGIGIGADVASPAGAVEMDVAVEGTEVEVETLDVAVEAAEVVDVADAGAAGAGSPKPAKASKRAKGAKAQKSTRSERSEKSASAPKASKGTRSRRSARPAESPEAEAVEPSSIELPEGDVISPAETAVLDRTAIRAAARAAAEAAERREVRRRRTLDEDMGALLELLAEGPIDSVPLEQLLIRDLGTPTFVSEGFCSVDLPNGARCLWGEDVIEARRVLSRQKRPNLVICLSGGLEPMVRRIFPTDSDTLWYTLAVYQGTEPLPVESDLRIEPLDNSWAGFVNRTYSFPGGINGAELAHMLSHGVVLGGFTPEGKLVGYIGEWREGAMGMLEVLPHARHRGYGSALEASKINEHLSRGWTPFAQIMDGNDASLRLQQALGLSLAEEKQCYIPMT